MPYKVVTISMLTKEVRGILRGYAGMGNVAEIARELSPGCLTRGKRPLLSTVAVALPPSGLDAFAHAIAAAVRLGRMGYPEARGYEETPPELA